MTTRFWSDELNRWVEADVAWNGSAKALPWQQGYDRAWEQVESLYATAVSQMSAGKKELLSQKEMKGKGVSDMPWRDAPMADGTVPVYCACGRFLTRDEVAEKYVRCRQCRKNDATPPKMGICACGRKFFRTAGRKKECWKCRDKGLKARLGKKREAAA